MVAAHPKKGLLLWIALIALAYQLAYSRVLSWTSQLVGASLQEEEGDLERFKITLEVCAWGLSLLRLVNLSAILSAILGLIGLQRESIPLIRLFTINSAFDIALSLLLTLIIALVTLTSSSTSATSFCDLLANSDILTDLVGTGGIESCEERWRSVVGMFVVGAFLIAGARIWGLLKCNKELSRRQRRRGPSLSINTAAAAASRSGGGGERFYTDNPGSTTNSKRPRIFLLPTPHSSSTATPKQIDHSIPLLSLTPSSPADTFPPNHHPHFPPPPPPSSSPLVEDDTTTPTASRQSEPSYIVYAPIRMTAEEARKLSASEVVFHGGRTRSHSQLQSPLSALASGGGSESTMKLA